MGSLYDTYYYCVQIYNCLKKSFIIKFCDHLFVLVVICQYLNDCIIFHSYLKISLAVSFEVKLTMTTKSAILFLSVIPTEMNSYVHIKNSTPRCLEILYAYLLQTEKNPNFFYLVNE